MTKAVDNVLRPHASAGESVCFPAEGPAASGTDFGAFDVSLGGTEVEEGSRMA